MKKIIAILLVLVVGFSAFAIDGDTDATLTLEASVTGVLFHGFTNAIIATQPNASTISDILASVSSTVSLNLEEETGEVPIGYYNLFSTGRTGQEVTFTVNPLAATIDSITYNVPYMITLGTANGANVTVNPTYSVDLGITSGPVIGTISPLGSEINVLTTNDGGGRKWASVPVLITFDDGANLDFGLPETVEGEEFSATIVANITAID